MTWFFAAAWVGSGVMCWDCFDRYCEKTNQARSPLVRDLVKLHLMLLGPVIFAVCLLTPEREDGP